jgi:hypothetical protein
MSAPRDLDGLLTTFLKEGPLELPDPSYDEVRDRMEHRRQRTFIGPWRTPDMTNFARVGLAAAAVVIVAVVAVNLLPGSPAPGGEPSASPSVEPSEAAPSTVAWTGLPAGPFVVTRTDDPVQVTVDIASPGWSSGRSELGGTLFKGYGAELDVPESVGVGLIVSTWPAGTVFNVYADPCLWRTTVPSTAATTPEEFAAALAAQAQSDATAPVDVTVGGYTGKATTLTVPMSYYIDADASREEEFADCDESNYGFYASEMETEPFRAAQGPGEVDELWILAVNGSIVILDATYGPAAPADLVAELRALAESAGLR